MKKYYYLIIIALILGLVLAGCSLLSNIGQAPATDQSGITYLTKGLSPVLAARWKFDEESGALTVADSSGNGNTGTVVGATTGVAGTFGNALSFDGVDDYVSVAQSAYLDMTSAYTLEAWVNVTDDLLPNKYRPILFRGTTNANDIEVYVQAASKDLIVAHNRGNRGTFDYVGFVDPPLGTPFHLAVTFDGTNVQAYYNFTAAGVSQQTTAMTAPLDTDKAWWIGKVDHSAFNYMGSGNLHYFKGIIDEVRIWSSVLDYYQLNDMTPPVITMLGTSPVTVEVGSTYTDAGATALDDVDGDLTGSIATVNPVNTALVGIYTVTYDVSDAAGNPAIQVTRTVNVVDTTPPVITLLGISPITIEVGSAYVDAGATALDKYDGVITGSIVTVNPVNTAVVGTYTVTYDVSDAAGNPAIQVTRTVNVVYKFGGILQPINADGNSIFKLGSTVPVKFQLPDASGAFVTDAEARIYLLKISNCVNGTELEAVSTSAATTGNLFRYDSTSNQYIFNLNTKPLSIGTWQIRIQLDDGTDKYVNISLK